MIYEQSKGSNKLCSITMAQIVTGRKKFKLIVFDVHFFSLKLRRAKFVIDDHNSNKMAQISSVSFLSLFLTGRQIWIKQDTSYWSVLFVYLTSSIYCGKMYQWQ